MLRTGPRTLYAPGWHLKWVCIVSLQFLGCVHNWQDVAQVNGKCVQEPNFQVQRSQHKKERIEDLGSEKWGLGLVISEIGFIQYPALCPPADGTQWAFPPKHNSWGRRFLDSASLTFIQWLPQEEEGNLWPQSHGQVASKLLSHPVLEPNLCTWTHIIFTDPVLPGISIELGDLLHGPPFSCLLQASSSVSFSAFRFRNSITTSSLPHPIQLSSPAFFHTSCFPPFLLPPPQYYLTSDI